MPLQIDRLPILYLKFSVSENGNVTITHYKASISIFIFSLGCGSRTSLKVLFYFIVIVIVLCIIVCIFVCTYIYMSAIAG